MSRRGPRQVVFVCSAVLNEKLVSEMVEQESAEDAQKAFSIKHGSKPEAILGPFFRKRMGVLNNQVSVRFTGKTKPVIYNDWYCKAMLLDQPADCVWLFFEARVDGKRQTKPQNFIIRSDEAQFLTPEQEVEYKRVVSAVADKK